MAFRIEQKVLFKFCDPAGIVFFPRVFELINDCVEQFFDRALGWPFEVLLTTQGVPTVDIRTRFVAPSRHGDLLHLTLRVIRVGRTSMSYHIRTTCGDELRFETEATLVHVGGDGRPVPWPDDIAAKLARLAEEGT